MKKEAKKQLTVTEQASVNMSRKAKRCLTVAGNLRAKAAECIKEAEKNEANAAGYKKVAEVLTAKNLPK